MSENRVELRSVAWREVFPWLVLVRVFRLAVSMPMLFLATVGVCFTPVGWHAAEWCLLDADRQTVSSATLVAERTWPGQRAGWERVLGDPGVIPLAGAHWTAPLQQVYLDSIRPFRALFDATRSWTQLGYYAVGGLWTLVVWALFGGALNRAAVMQLGRQEREGMFASLGFAVRRWRSYAMAPLFPLFGVAVVVACCLPVGWIMQWDGGVLVAGLLWPLVLLGGLFATVMAIGLLVGWPLMWGAISAEEMGDVFEGNQRSFSYTFGRPWHYLFYATVALLLGSAGFVLVRFFAEGVIALSTWAVSWGAGPDRLANLSSGDTGPLVVGRLLIEACHSLVLTVASAYRYSFFWCAAAGIYLLLRRDMDATELDDVHVADEIERYNLPPRQEAAQEDAAADAPRDAES